MECVTARVKRWLSAGRTEHDSASIYKAFGILKASAAEAGSGTPASSELFILCCEESIAMELWDVAQSCVDFFHGEMTCNRMLEARALYCTGIVEAHFISEDLHWNEVIEERLHCASSIIRGITIAVEEWPREAWAVVHGTEKLWHVIAPLYQFGHFKSIIDIVGFVLTLHEKLMIGGGNTFIQWVTRLSVCLRGSGRIHDAIAYLNTAMESAVRINSERLQIQLLRVLTSFIADSGASSGSKSKQETSKLLLHQAVQVSQLFMAGHSEIATAKPDLIAVYDRLILASNAEKETPPPVVTSKIKGKAKNTIPELMGDAEIIQEVMSDVVLCLAICNEGKRCDESIQKLRSSLNTRARTFGHYAKIVATAFETGVMESIDSPDASYLTPATIDMLFKCIHEVESAMDGAKMIQDGSERGYSLQVGCCLLWNFCLPLLQDATHPNLQHVLSRIVKESDACSLSRPEFQVRVEYESSVAEFNEDNLSLVVRRINKALSRGFSVTHPDGTVYFPMNFSLLWLLRRCEIRTAADVSELSTMQDQAMYYLEQAEVTTSSTKAIAAIKTSFSKLPLLTPDDRPDPVVVPLPPKEARENKKGKVVEGVPHRPPRHSLSRLYLQLLIDCVRNLTPSLLSIAKSTAMALCSMEVSSDVKYMEFIYMKGHSSLLLTQVLLMELETATEEEKVPISAALFKAFSDASATEAVLQSLGCSSAWMTINSCQLYLDYKAASFSEGNFRNTSSELGQMYGYFIALHIDFERESSLTIDLSLMYILSLLDDYIKSKGGFPPPMHQPTTYNDFVEAVVSFTPKTVDAKSDQSLASLKRAQEVCVEVMQRILLPSEKAHICRLYPTICRLLSMKAEATFHYPQEQLLNLLGRIAGPLTPNERRNLVVKEAWELLQQDPSVQLCGQVAFYAAELGEERLVLDICKLADDLYQDGKLGFGTVFPPVPLVEKVKGDKKEVKESNVVTPNLSAPFPKPKCRDWFWYCNLLLFQAEVYARRCGGIHPESNKRISLLVLTLCANSAIAAVHGPVESRHSRIVTAMRLYYHTVCNLWRAGNRGRDVLPSLKMMLSSHVLSSLQVDVSEKVTITESMRHVFEMITLLGHMMVHACTSEGLFQDGMNSLTVVLSVLPKKLHSSFKAEEVRIKCELGLPVSSILHSVKTEDVETASLVWMKFAQYTTDQSKSVEAWKYAVNVLSGYPYAKANCLLEMSQHVSVHGLLPTNDVKLLLLSAIDLIEGIDRAVNESCVSAAATLQPILDERAKFFPSKLIATLTGRSLIAPALALKTTNVTTLRKNLQPATMKDVMLAIRIVYMLFCIADLQSEANDNITKKECAILLLHYIDCLWRLAEAVVSKGIDEWTKDTPPPPKLDLPSRFGGWYGFFFKEEHVELLRAGAPSFYKYNTEGLQGIFMELVTYLGDEHMDHYCFLVHSWILFAAGWRYGWGDIRFLLVKRMVYLGCKVACTLCGCGHQTHLYHVDSFNAAQTAALKMKLTEISLPGPLPPPRSIFFSPHIGSIQDVILTPQRLIINPRLTNVCFTLIDVIQRRCELLEDWDTYAQCIISRCVNYIIHCKVQSALALLMEEEAKGVLEKISPMKWLRWEQCKVEVFTNLGRADEIVNANLKFMATVKQLAFKVKPNTVAFDMVTKMGPRLIELYQAFVMKHVTPQIRISTLKFTVAECLQLRQLVSDMCDIHERAHDAGFTVCVTRYRLRRIILEGQTVESMASVLQGLASEAANIDRLLGSLSISRAEVSRTLCLETSETPLHSATSVFEAFLLYLRGENIMTRLRIAQAVLDAYRELTMEQLGIPTGGPPELEKHVLDFIRDPTRERGPEADQEEQRRREIKWSQSVKTIGEEIKNAFEYYNLSLDQIGDASAFDCRMTLYQAKDVCAKWSAFNVYSSQAMAQIEIRCFLEKQLQAEASSLSVEARIDEMLTRRWSVCPLVQVEKIIPGKKGATEKTKKSKDSVGECRPRIPPLEITESQAHIANVLFESIEESRRLCDFSFLTDAYLTLADFFTVLNRPQSAGTAVEFALAAKLMGSLINLSFAMMEDTDEKVAWECLQQFTSKFPLLCSTPEFGDVHRAAVESSPMLAYAKQALEWPEEPELPTFAFPDIVTLSIVQVTNPKNTFMVVLRHPDGSVDSRRKRMQVEKLNALTHRFEEILCVKRQVVLEETRAGTVRAEPSVVLSDIQDFLMELQATIHPLIEDFEEALENLATKNSIYLILDPVIQSVPIDFLPCFTAFVSVQRELSVMNIKAKLDQKLTKSATVLHVIDPFGDHVSSVDQFTSEKKSNKDNHILTSIDKTFPLSVDYLMWVLEQPTYQAVLFNMCGCLSSLLSSSAAVSIRWSHIQTVMIAADAVNETSMRREQKNDLTKDTRACVFDQKWLLPLLLLLRGVRFVAMNACPSTPLANDALCKRVVPALAAGRGVFEACTGRHAVAKNAKSDTRKSVESGRKDLVLFYGVPSLSVKGK